MTHDVFTVIEILDKRLNARGELEQAYLVRCASGAELVVLESRLEHIQ